MKSEGAPWGWQGFTVMVSFTFATDLATGACALVLDLAEDAKPGSRAVSLQFDTVTDLTLSQFGGGITQLVSLDVRDVSQQQWDRQCYQVVELENHSISFRCQRYGVLRQYTV